MKRAFLQARPGLPAAVVAGAERRIQQAGHSDACVRTLWPLLASLASVVLHCHLLRVYLKTLSLLLDGFGARDHMLSFISHRDSVEIQPGPAQNRTLKGNSFGSMQVPQHTCFLGQRAPLFPAVQQRRQGRNAAVITRAVAAPPKLDTTTSERVSAHLPPPELLKCADRLIAHLSKCRSWVCYAR